MSLEIVKDNFGDIKSHKFGFSSGSAGHVVDRVKKSNETHHITTWPFAELSITKTPAEPRALIHSIKSLKDFYGDMSSPEHLQDPGNSDITDMTDPEDSTLMKVIEMLIAELTKKSIEEFVTPELSKIKEILEDIKSKTLLPDGSGEAELTVLKSENEELKTSKEELQSSFDEKEALLSEKMVLLSELEAELETKSQVIVTLEEKINELTKDLDTTKESLRIQRVANRVLTKSTTN